MSEMFFKKVKTENFEHIYQDMIMQFPACELKDYEEFRCLLNHNVLVCNAVFDGENEVGYVIYAILKNNNIWLDYIAIKKEFQSKGYGRKIFELINNCYLEVEKPNEDDINTLRRIKFYKSLGAKKLDLDYIYPNKDGGVKMDLYYLGEKIPSKITINSDIKYVFNTLHSDIHNLDKILKKIIA